MGLYEKIKRVTLIRYGFCGGVTLTVDAVCYAAIYNFIIAQRYIDLGCIVVSPHIASLILVFPITFFTGFLLNRYVVFGQRSDRANIQLGKYLLSGCGSIVLNYVLMKLLVEACGLWPTPSKIVTSVIVAGYSFLMARYFTWRQRLPKERKANGCPALH